MLTSFFRKSKPINFLVVFILAAIFYIIYNFTGNPLANESYIYVKKIGIFLLYSAIIFFINFITSIQKAKNRDTYVLFIFTLLCLSSPAIFRSEELMISAFLIILGLRRTLALQTGFFFSRKLFDACFCFALGSLFFPPAIIFTLIPFIGVSYYCSDNYKNWFIPISAIIAVFILMTCFTLFTTDSFFSLTEFYQFSLNDFDIFLQNQLLLPLGLGMISGIWFYTNLITSQKKLAQKERKANHILLATLGLSILILSVSPDHLTVPSLLFAYIPIAIFGGQYFQNVKKIRLNEIILLTLITLSLTIGILTQWNLI